MKQNINLLYNSISYKMDFYLSVGFFLSFILFSWISLLSHKSYKENYNEVSHTVFNTFFGASASAAYFFRVVFGKHGKSKEGMEGGRRKRRKGTKYFILDYVFLTSWHYTGETFIVSIRPPEVQLGLGFRSLFMS